ncbi:MAG: LysR family transcriptional regulator [Rhizobiales bacterium 24-66-13]|nr:MAG: LysR family transcriptional regulator [Rhizobiales bacterium 24-66-13]
MPYDARLLGGIGVLAAVVEAGSFVGAARALGLTQPGISRAVARLETRIGVRLLDRTTRAVSLTHEGRRFYEQVMPLLAGIADAARLAGGSSTLVRGRLRVNMDPFFSRLLVAEQIGAFLDRYPEVSLEMLAREEVGDLVAEGFDVAVRFGVPRPSSLVARKLLETRILTVAAPAYLARQDRPRHPSELSGHACIQFRDPLTAQPFAWEFHRGREIVPVATHGRLLVSDVGTMLGACVAGVGIAQVMELGVRPLLADGRLVELFPDWPGETFPLYALHPSRHLPAAKVRAFVDFTLEILDAPAARAGAPARAQ